jgi:hypothetical protein
MAEGKRKLAAVVDKVFFVRFVKAQKNTTFANKSEFVRVLLDEALKARGE